MLRDFMLAVLTFSLASFAFADEGGSLRTVPAVDLTKYAGKWYEIARYPNRFQKNCASDVTAMYTLRPDGKVQVVNQCRKADGKSDVARGTAKVADSSTNSKLKVTFFWPFYGNYWIIGLDPEYRYAIVGEPDRKYLWILSRTPKLDKALYDNAIARIQESGYDPARLVQTPHSDHAGN